MKATELLKKTKNPNDVLHILFFEACAQIDSNERFNSIETVLNECLVAALIFLFMPIYL